MNQSNLIFQYLYCKKIVISSQRNIINVNSEFRTDRYMANKNKSSILKSDKL